VTHARHKCLVQCYTVFCLSETVNSRHVIWQLSRFRSSDLRRVMRTMMTAMT
jgi:hypothetical protein